MTRLHDAVRDGDVASVHALLAWGDANVDAVDEAGRNGLHIAVMRRQREAAQRLLQEHSVGVDEMDAGRGSEADCLALLLVAGVAIDCADEEGYHAIHLTAKAHDVEATEMLLEAGASVHSVTNAGDSPLDLTVFSPMSSSALETIRVLCGFGAEWTTSSHNKLVVLERETEARELPATAALVRQLMWCKGLRASVLHWEQQRRDDEDELTEIPYDVIEQGEASVKKFLAGVVAVGAAEVVDRFKVCVVGPSGWGKSSLVRSIEAMKPLLMDTEDPKIGIDLVSSYFSSAAAPVDKQHKESTPSPTESDKLCHVTFWDFGGQDEYQAAHAMFYSRQTLYVLVVDLDAYTKQLDKVHSLRPSHATVQMDRFTNRYVFRWMHAILSRQTDGEFLLLGTKADLLKNEKDDSDLVWRDLQNRIFAWKEKRAHELKDEWKSMAVNAVGFQRAEYIKELQQSLDRLASSKWLVVSATRRESILAVRNTIRLWAEAKLQKIPMGVNYLRVLDRVIKRRQIAKSAGGEEPRIANTIVNTSVLCRELASEIQGLQEEECRVILRRLHNLGELVWYEGTALETWRELVVLDPMLLLDIVGPVISYTGRTTHEADCEVVHNDCVIAHELLKTLSMWKHLGIDLMEDFKLLLNHFQLAYPALGPKMRPESDLIVPTYWRARTTSDFVRSPFAPLSRSDISNAGDHCWEYHMTGSVSEKIYDQLVIQSHDPLIRRDVRANGFEAISGDFRVQVTWQSSESSSETISIVAATVVVSDAWKMVRLYLQKLENVLAMNSESRILRYVLKNGKAHKLQEAVTAREDMIARRKDPNDARRRYPWMPPDLDWYEQGLRAAKTYMEQMKASKKIVSRRQICVVGPSTTGKTSLIKSLIDREVNLEQLSKRTIGIDHWLLKFPDPNQDQFAVPRSHEVTFSDFAGQDVYQAMHSLFFTKDTLFLICVDLDAYSITLLKAEILTRNEVKMQHMMNEYVDLHILRWIRIIVARQPSAEFAFVLMKDDTISSGPGVDKAEVLAHANMMLKRVMVIVANMKKAPENQPIGNSSRPITHLWDNQLTTCKTYPTFTTIMTNSTTRSSVRVMRKAIERLIVESDKSYDMPESYMQVLQEIRKKTLALKDEPAHLRVQHAFVEVGALVEDLQKQFPSMDEDLIKIILRSLRDRGDILWYEELDDVNLGTTVILDRLLIIQLLREVFNHKHATGTLYHNKLKRLPLWRDLDSHPAVMLAMKWLLQEFQLAYSTTQEMAHDSDLIVPAYWKTNMHSLWVFGGDRLRLDPRGRNDEAEAFRVDWEFSFTYFIPETFFDQLIVASYSQASPLEIGPDWILYRNAQLAACRIVESRDRETHQRSLRLEAVLAQRLSGVEDATALWVVFKRLCKALARVLKAHAGLPHTSFARANDDRQPTLLSLSQDENLSTMKESWLPPALVSVECLQLLFHEQ